MGNLHNQIKVMIQDTFSAALDYRYDDKSEAAINGIKMLSDILATDIVKLGGQADLQHDIATWAREAFPDTPEPALFNKLRDEVLELGQERHAYWLETDKGDSPEKGDARAIVTEMADCLHMMFQIADRFGFDLLDETRRKFEVNRSRTWKSQPAGTYQHVEASDATP